MNMFAAIAVSPCNKATTLSENKHNIIVQQRYNHNFYWFHIWILGHVMGDVEVDATPSTLKEKAKFWEFDPNTTDWESIP
jgi:hypothetical protein